jgi:ubiquinone/menaquinone biosynthesis C-methylase UbiE
VRRPEFIARQSRCPSGFLGRVIGHVMSFETAAANDEALKALDLKPADRVLEVGFGHGRTIERAASMVPQGLVVGIDASEEMLQMATRRCRRLIDQDRVRLTLGDSAHLPYPDQFFDKGYAIHTIYFWDDPKLHLCELYRVLRDGARFVLGFHPKGEEGTADFPETVYSFYTSDQVLHLLQAAGFADARVERPGGAAGGLALGIGHRQADRFDDAAGATIRNLTGRS